MMHDGGVYTQTIQVRGIVGSIRFGMVRSAEEEERYSCLWTVLLYSRKIPPAEDLNGAFPFIKLLPGRAEKQTLTLHVDMLNRRVQFWLRLYSSGNAGTTRGRQWLLFGSSDYFSNQAQAQAQLKLMIKANENLPLPGNGNCPWLHVGTERRTLVLQVDDLSML
jgi:hypothetical protein